MTALKYVAFPLDRPKVRQKIQEEANQNRRLNLVRLAKECEGVIFDVEAKGLAKMIMINGNPSPIISALEGACDDEAYAKLVGGFAYSGDYLREKFRLAKEGNLKD
jgi:hypothetical protein